MLPARLSIKRGDALHNKFVGHVEEKLLFQFYSSVYNLSIWSFNDLTLPFILNWKKQMAKYI